MTRPDTPSSAYYTQYFRRSIHPAKMLAACFLGIAALASPVAQSADVVLDIPSTYPRLWYGNPQRLAQARLYAQTNPVPIPTYPNSAKARNRALRSLMTSASPSNDPDCAAAVRWLQSYDLEASREDDEDNVADPGPCNMDAQSVSCDRARWGGEDAILVYDWCHAYVNTLPATEKQRLVTKWNNYISVMNDHPYNWEVQQGNNYYAGYMRNSLLWGITTFGENAAAQGFINAALQTRLENNTAPWAATFGAGGVPAEGPQYGAYQLGYPVIAFQSVRDFGYDAYQKTAFYNDATYYLQYATLPSPTYNAPTNSSRYELYPFSDIGENDANTAYTSDYANLLALNIVRAPTTARARHAKAWLQRTGTQPDWWVKAVLSSNATAAGDSDMPRDYFASGYGFLYARSASVSPTMALLMSNDSVGSEESGGSTHDSRIAGAFQLWRNGIWMSRASFGYRGSDDAYLTGFRGQGRVWADHGLASNMVLFGGPKGATYQMEGPVSAKSGRTRMLRLESADAYTYAAVDLKPAYRAPPPGNACWLAGDDWPFAEVMIREYVYLRGWDALLIFDRMRSGNASTRPPYTDPCGSSGYDGPRLEADQVVKSFLLHFPGNPTITGNRVSANTPANQPRQQALDAHILLPQNVAPRIIDERSCCGSSNFRAQFRMELDQTGSAEGHNLVVVRARDISVQPLDVQFAQAGADLVVTFQRQSETATIRLRAGMTSTGGSVQFGTQTAQPFYTGVQPMTISDDGPKWQPIDDVIFKSSFQ